MVLKWQFWNLTRVLYKAGTVPSSLYRVFTWKFGEQL